jgi:Na+-transporting methylmalonyl-CoA/oxaloacetate decarboxylase gamma subunit
MMWLVLSLVVICLILMIGNRPAKEPIIAQSNDLQEFPLSAALSDVEAEDEYLIAVITAAIHEFTGGENFEVVKIKPSAKNWTLIGRQNLMSNR